MPPSKRHGRRDGGWREVPTSLYAATTARMFFAACLALITIDAPAWN